MHSVPVPRGMTPRRSCVRDLKSLKISKDLQIYIDFIKISLITQISLIYKDFINIAKISENKQRFH